MKEEIRKTYRPEKVAAVREVTEAVAGSDYCFILDYTGLTVTAFTELRGALAKAGSKVKVVKNSYLSIAAKAKGWDLSDLAGGQTAMITGNGDPAEVAKVTVAFLEKNEKAAIKGAELSASRLSAEDVKTLSKLPSKDILRAQLLALFNAPATSLVRLFAAPATGVLYALNAKAGAMGEAN